MVPAAESKFLIGARNEKSLAAPHVSGEPFLHALVGTYEYTYYCYLLILLPMRGTVELGYATVMQCFC